MFVEELIGLLQIMPGDAEVFMSLDAEGNGYNHVDGLSVWENNNTVVVYPTDGFLDYDDVIEDPEEEGVFYSYPNEDI